MYVPPAAVEGGAEGVTVAASSDSASRMLESLRCAFAKASRIFLGSIVCMYVCMYSDMCMYCKWDEYLLFILMSAVR